MNDRIEITLEKDMVMALGETRLPVKSVSLGSDLDALEPIVSAEFHCPVPASNEKYLLSCPDKDTGQEGLLAEVVRVPCRAQAPDVQSSSHLHFQAASPADSEKILRYIQSCALHLTRKSP